MKESYYLFASGTLSRHNNTLRLVADDGMTRDLPVEKISDIYCFGTLKLNTQLFSFLASHGICLHIFNYYENYRGTYYPREQLLSGRVHIAQAGFYVDNDKRLVLAKAFLNAAAGNILRNLRYYNERGRDVASNISRIKMLIPELSRAQGITQLMGVEGNIRRLYYEAWDDIFTVDTGFNRRERQPPTDMVNCLISFLNMMLYSTTVSEIYSTQLDPTISFLHEPGERRFSLSLDLAEVFKPLIVDRMIFTLINKRMVDSESFEKHGDGMVLRERAKKLIVTEYDNRLKQTIKHKTLGRSVSYRRLIRLEAYKLMKHLLNETEYEGFQIWW